MATSNVEDYLKQIFLIEQGGPGERASNGALAAALGVTPASVTTMVKTLAESGLVDYEAYGGARLTDKGRQLAVRVLRRHRLVELFLVRVLRLDWSEVHEEAERLEHAVSERVVDRIDELLGRPGADPHGHPIPSAAGEFGSSAATPLDQVEPGRRVRVARVSDHDAAFLRAIEKLGLRPGTRLTVRSRDAATDSLAVTLGRGRREVLGLRAAARILVEC
ncbi:MAG: ideR [Acidobacteria bacterium]|jgi:DtxR family Mn-dependent transcriptional regulator|nr:ideR [Acidobacteriota bacterium]